MISARAYAAATASAPLAPFSVERRDPGPHDVLIDIKFCGVCHSDLHCAHGVRPEIEIIDVKDINTAYERLLKGDVRYRFVIDSATLQA